MKDFAGHKVSFVQVTCSSSDKSFNYINHGLMRHLKLMGLLIMALLKAHSVSPTICVDSTETHLLQQWRSKA